MSERKFRLLVDLPGGGLVSDVVESFDEFLSALDSAAEAQALRIRGDGLYNGHWEKVFEACRGDVFDGNLGN